MPESIGLAMRSLLCESFITLDGEPAKITGRLEPFATISALPDGPSYQWSWKSTLQIVRNCGNFKS